MDAHGYDSLNRVMSISADGQTQHFAYDVRSNGVGRLCTAYFLRPLIGVPLLALGGVLGTAISGLGEVPSLGTDAPATVSLVAVTGFFADASLITGTGAAALHSFASGSTNSLATFDFNRLEEFGMTANLSRLPGVGKYAELIGGLAGKATDIATEAPLVCLNND